MEERILAYMEREIAAIRSLDYRMVAEAVEAIKAAYEREATIYVFGNGGSAATASHMVCDFNKGISDGLAKKFHLLCLNDNIPIMLAIANDIGYEDVFAYQLQGRVQPGDLLIAISGSGNSRNIIKAVEYARSCGAKVVGMTGYSGGKLKELADYSMHVPVADMQITEDLHMIFDHMMYRIFNDILK